MKLVDTLTIRAKLADLRDAYEKIDLTPEQARELLLQANDIAVEMVGLIERLDK